MWKAFLELLGCEQKKEAPAFGEKLFIVLGTVYVFVQRPEGYSEVIGHKVYYLNTFTDYDAAIKCADQWMSEPAITAWDIKEPPGMFHKKNFYIARWRPKERPEHQAFRNIYISGFVKGEGDYLK